ncbi:AMP nucleosidase [Corynebacterium ulceribovis]|uniref:AMP nucleosidase n=1 Tax=Corynebacterium ulceribovis TaxID=487732 RepID=UPI000373B327|nr:AMP nucleosidase [Corynebacterium ulceribovis]
MTAATLPDFPRLSTTDVAEAIAQLADIYDASTQYLAEKYQSYRDGELPEEPVQVCYPEIVVNVEKVPPLDSSLANGFIEYPGTYRSVLTRPRMFHDYLAEQLTALRENNDVTFEIGVSDQPIPVEFLPDYAEIKGSGEGPAGADERAWFTPIDLTAVDDRIADTGYIEERVPGAPEPDRPLFLFKAQRVDLACSRLEHYTGTSVEDIQQFIVFTNYALHTEEFVEYALGRSDERLAKYQALVGPGMRVDLASDPDTFPTNAAVHANQSKYQMPAYHLTDEDGTGVTIVNIGVGPSNAKTITDCLAVLRPQCWIMIGHCAGLDGRMRLGDLLLANAYERKDAVLDKIVPLTTPIPPIPELQRALIRSIEENAQLEGEQYRRSVRTGTILSTADRNWEWETPTGIAELFGGSTAIGLEMESCTVATNGYRYRVPYAALLSVSDLPLHHVPKLPGSAREFYLRSKRAHLMVAVRACEELSDDPALLYTRKLRRTLREVPMR